MEWFPLLPYYYSATFEFFNTGKSMSFRCGYIFLISQTSYELNGIFKLCTTQADICVQPDTDVELMSNDTAESILCDLDRAMIFSVFLEGLTFAQSLSSTR